MKSNRGLPKKTGLRSTTTTKKLIKKKSIKQSKGVVKSPKKRLKLEQKSAQQLIKVADKEYSRYIRLRDSEPINGDWIGRCITCPRNLTVKSGDKWIASSQNGHFIGRGVHQLRYDENNTHLQCAHCNAWRDKHSMLEAFEEAIKDKCGEDVLLSLIEQSKAEGALKRLTKPELLQVIKDSREQVDYYERTNRG